jgi:hypothetical protein
MRDQLVTALMTLVMGAGVLAVIVHLLFGRQHDYTHTHLLGWTVCTMPLAVYGTVTSNDYYAACCFAAGGLVALVMFGITLSTKPQELWLPWLNVAVQMATQFVAVTGGSSLWLLPAHLTSILLVIITFGYIYCDPEVISRMTVFNGYLEGKRHMIRITRDPRRKSA